MSITHWPLLERPREKLLLHGAKNLSDAELLALFINTGTKGKTALDIARELLSEFGSLRSLLQSPPHLLCQKNGVGKAKYALLQAALEMGMRYLNSQIQPGTTLNSSVLTKSFLSNQLRHHPHEVFACLYLDSQNRLIRFEELFTGSLTEANVYPREVVKRALGHNAAKIILAHNHPSGNPEPSESDHIVTQLLQKALALVDILLVDHIVIGHQDSVSFAESGLLP